MRAVVQRVSSATVTVDELVVGEIGQGLLILLGVHKMDTEADAGWLADKIAALRVFEDEAGKMNRSLLDLSSTPAHAGEPPRATALVVSQFTLLASTRKGNRPSFNDAASPDLAVLLYDDFMRNLQHHLGRPVAAGKFGAMMKVTLVNNGPVTLVLDSRAKE
jgi:D-tyrosyl-tRNA(Tyr) deacylase